MNMHVCPSSYELTIPCNPPERHGAFCLDDGARLFQAFCRVRVFCSDEPLPVRRSNTCQTTKEHHGLYIHPCFHRIRHSWLPGLFISEHELRQIRAAYYRMISKVDAQIERLTTAIA